MEKKLSKKEVIFYRFLAQKNIRNYFLQSDFIEVDTPYLLKSNAPDPYIDPIFVNLLASNQSRQLHTSPEFFLKRVLALGFDKVFEIAKVFRDDPIGKHHNPEFSMVEWYRAGEDLQTLLSDCEQIFSLVNDAYSQVVSISNKQKTLKIEIVTVEKLFLDFLDIDLADVQNKIFSGQINYLQEYLISKGHKLRNEASFADAFFHLFLNYIEPKLPFEQPLAISRWPIQLAALSSPCMDNSNFCDRFEIYFRGLEIANAYQECIRQDVIRARFIKENYERQLLKKPQFELDEDFLKSLDGLKETVGIALGLDRLLMAVAKKEQIKDIFL